jgi:ribosomal-protein-alanine N-acetyltransferase
VGHDKLSFAAMQAEDIPAVMALEAGSLAAWNKKHLEDELKQQSGFQFVARYAFAEQLLAVLCGRIAADEGEILKLAVDRTVRQQGIGVQLLNFCLKYCREQGVKRCYLELRASNAAARQVYQKCGFAEAGIRKNYYNSPGEDAILMQREL